MSDINAGSVSVEVVPDARLFAERLRTQLRDAQVKVVANADTAEASAKLDEVSRDREAAIDANADTAEAERKLDEVARPRTAPVTADTKGAEQGMNNLLAAALALGPALVPVAAATAGLAAALSAPLAAAGGGVTLFGLLAGKTVADTEKLNKQINALDAKAASLTDPKAKKAVIAQRDALFKSLSDSQQKFLTEQATFSGKLSHYESVYGDYILGPLTQGMKDLADILPRTSRLLRPASSALTTLLDEVDSSMKSGTLARFFGFLSRNTGHAIESLGTDLGNIGAGITGLIQASAPLSSGAMSGLERLTGRFAQWGQNAGSNNFQDFLRYARKEGPQVAQTLGDIAGAFGAIALDAAPVGGTVLKGIDALARLLDRIAKSDSGPTLIAAAAGFAAVKKAMQIGGAIKDSSLVAKLFGRSAAGSLGKFAVTEAGGAIPKGVVPVYVTNKGFGPGGGDNPAKDIPKAAPLALAAAAPAAFATAGAAAIYYGSKYGSTRGQIDSNKIPAYVRQHVQANGQQYVGSPYAGMGYRAGVYAPKSIRGLDYSGPIERDTQALLAAKGAWAEYNRVMAQTPKWVRTMVSLPNIDYTTRMLSRYDAMLERLNGKVVNTYLHQLVTKGPVAGGGHPIYARAAGGPVTSGHPYLVGEQGPELLVPSQSGRVIPARQTAQMLQNGRTGGVDVHIHGDVRAHDYRDFMHQMQQRSRTAALGGGR